MLSMEEETAKMDIELESLSPPQVREQDVLVETQANGTTSTKMKPSHSSMKAKSKSKPKKAASTKTDAASEPDKSLIETQQDMYDRLKKGVTLSKKGISGLMIAGIIENPTRQDLTVTRTRKSKDYRNKFRRSSICCSVDYFSAMRPCFPLL